MVPQGPIHLQFLILKTYSCFLLKLSSWSQSRLPKTIDHCKTQVCCNNQDQLQSHLALYCPAGSHLFLIPFVKYETTPSETDVVPKSTSGLDWDGWTGNLQAGLIVLRAPLVPIVITLRHCHHHWHWLQTAIARFNSSIKWALHCSTAIRDALIVSLYLGLLTI